jgi:hypothetical protein
MGSTETASKPAVWQMGVLNAEIRFQRTEVGEKFIYHPQLLAEQVPLHRLLEQEVLLHHHLLAEKVLR